jgi:hypothetical protein
MNDVVTPLIALAVLALAAFLVYRIVLHVRQKSAERRAALRSLGFEPVPSSDGEVVSTIVDLCKRWRGDRYRVDNLLERRGSDHRLLLFDLHDTSADNDHPGLLAVISRRLDLPRFTLYPRLEMEGRLAAVTNAVLEKLVRHQGKTVAFPAHPSFDRRHFVSGGDEGEIRRFFDEDRLAALAEKQYLMIEAGGDCFIAGRVYLRGRPSDSDLDDVSQRVGEAEELLRLFSRQR